MKIASADDPVVANYATALATLEQATAARVAAEQRLADAQFALSEAQAAETDAISAHGSAKAAFDAALIGP